MLNVRPGGRLRQGGLNWSRQPDGFDGSGRPRMMAIFAPVSHPQFGSRLAAATDVVGIVPVRRMGVR